MQNITFQSSLTWSLDSLKLKANSTTECHAATDELQRVKNKNFNTTSS
jgi:hypothetical protein